MPTVKVFTSQGKDAGSLELAPGVFGADINLNCVREALNQYRSAQRRGTASTKTRHYASGGGAKPWRQKGTGRARAGSNRSPIWRGGAVVFGPLPRSYSFKVNKKKRHKAFCSVLTSFAREGKLFVLDDIVYEKPRTREVKSLLENLGIEGKTLIILGKTDKAFFLSCRNIPYVSVLLVDNVNIYALLDNDNLIITRQAVERLEANLG